MTAISIARSTFVGAAAFCIIAVGLPRHGAAFPAPLLERVDAAAPSPFPVPDELQGAVRFWRAIFTQHASERVVVHDRENMDIIWEVIELPRRADGNVDEKAARELVRERVDALRARLERLEIDPTPIDEEDRAILALTGAIGPDEVKARLAGASKRLRSQQGVADRFAEGLARSHQWLDEIRDILVAEGVPLEMAALPFVESMFNPRARSSAGAAGLWQLMPATARGLGLSVGKDDDERLDVLKATRAAAKMLRQNLKMLGTWPLALTAYNHGPYGVRRAVTSLGSTDLVYLIEHYKKSTWGFASKNFYAEFLAVIDILRERGEAHVALHEPSEAAQELVD